METQRKIIGFCIGAILASLLIGVGFAAGKDSGESDQFKKDCVKSYGIPIPNHENLCVTDSGVIAQ
jgi:hypothetical protein